MSFAESIYEYFLVVSFLLDRHYSRFTCSIWSTYCCNALHNGVLILFPYLSLITSSVLLATLAINQTPMAPTNLPPQNASCLCPSPAVDADEIRRLGKRFRKLDLDNSGSLSVEEFMSLPELQQNPLVQRVIDIFDADGNGEVDFKGTAVGWTFALWCWHFILKQDSMHYRSGWNGRTVLPRAIPFSRGQGLLSVLLYDNFHVVCSYWYL